MESSILDQISVNLILLHNIIIIYIGGTKKKLNDHVLVDQVKRSLFLHFFCCARLQVFHFFLSELRNDLF